MPNNIVVGANILTASTSKSFSDLGFTNSNITVIYGTGSGGNYVSWKPGRSINSLTSIEAGKGYNIIAKTAMDKTADFGATGSGGSGIVTLS